MTGAEVGGGNSRIGGNRVRGKLADRKLGRIYRASGAAMVLDGT